MPSNLLAAVDYGGYISLWKLILFVLGFFGWAPLVNWVFTDSQAVRTNTAVWTLAIVVSGIVTLFLWLLIPVFFVGFLFYLIVVSGTAMAYVAHRNSKVADFEKVLTADHFRGLFVNSQKKIEKSTRGITFFTANGNEAPVPEPKSVELDGFLAVCNLIDDGVWNRGEVIHLVPQREEYGVFYEIDGLSVKQAPKTREEVDKLIYYIKQLAGLEVQEKRKPQKGHFKAILPENKQTSWEVYTSGSTAGEQVRLQRVSELTSRKIEDLGFNENQFEAIENLREIKTGVVLVTGPKKSGVTSTFYTLLGRHDPFINNINTLEKEPAAELHNITQFSYTLSDTGTTTFARKLQSVFRKGPEIVGVGDCDDAQTASLCCSGANDGRIVYVAFEAGSVMEAIQKWIKFVGDKKQVADTLVAVINQRLVRKLCTDCRVPYQPNPALFKKFNIPPNETHTFYRPGEIEYDKHGKPIVCQTCQGTGFYGRVGLFETIHISDELREVIRQAKSSQEIASAFRRAKMLYIQEQAIKKVSAGITSINEVIRSFASESKK